MWLNWVIICLSLICWIVPSSQQDPNGFLLVTNSTSIFKLDNQKLNTSLITHLPPDDEVKNFDYSYKERLLFWINNLDSSVNVVHIDNGKRVHDLFRNQIASPEQLSIDWVTRKIYYIASGPYRIEAADYTGTNNTLIQLLPGQRPKCIALAPQAGLLFWSNEEHHTIERISMNGDEATHKLVVQNTSVISMTVDHRVGTIYWSDMTEGRIRSTSFDGRYQRKVFAIRTPSISYFHSSVYFLDAIGKQIASVFAVEGTKKDRLIEAREASTQLRYFSSLNQPHNASACQVANGGCSYLCLASSEPPFYSCGCPPGIQLTDDRRTCKSFADDFILIALKDRIDFISLDTKQFLAEPTKIRKQRAVRSIDYDPVEQRVYWTDHNQVKSALLNGTDERLLTECEQEYERIKIDPANRNIYLVKALANLTKIKDQWSLPSNFSIEVVSLAGGHKKTLIDDFIGRPRAIAVDPENRFFYWSDWSNEQPKIERVSFDLSVRQHIVTANISWPNGIVIDRELGRLYWCDAKPNKYWIEYSDLDGSNRQTLVKLNRQLVDLSLLDDYLYWVDMARDEVGRAHKLTGQYEIISNQKLDKIFGLTVVSKLNQPTALPNEVKARNCSQLRLAHDLCACSDGYELGNDGVTCSLGANNTCSIINGGCDHVCHQLVGSYRKCSCHAGYMLGIDQKRCLMKNFNFKNNCKIKNPCSHGCVQIFNTYHCTCPTGWTLNLNGSTCIKLYLTAAEFAASEKLASEKLSREQEERNRIDQHDHVWSVGIVILALCLLTIAGISFLIFKYLVERRKNRRLKESKEHMIKGGERKIEFGHSLSNMANSIVNDRSITGSSVQLDENQSLIAAGNPPPSPILNPYKFQYNPVNRQFVRTDSNEDLPTTSRQPDYRPNRYDDALTVSDVATETSIHLPAPPPTPSPSTRISEQFRPHNAAALPDNSVKYRSNHQTNHQSNYEPNFRSNHSNNYHNYYLGYGSGRSGSPVTTISTKTYQLDNPPNSLASSVPNLNKLDF